MTAFAKHARNPRVYFVGRSEQAADRIVAECKKLNPGGEYIFIKADVSLMANVDEVCKEIKSKETSINVLFQSQGSFSLGTETSEGLPTILALGFASRMRFIHNLLPLIQRSTSLKRVVNVLAGTKEGAIDESDWEGRNITGSPLKGRGQACAMTTLTLEILSKRAPDVSFIHDFPGLVKSNIGREAKGFGMKLFLGISSLLAPFIAVPTEESGERHVFLMASAKYPPASNQRSSGVPLGEGVEVARGTDGKAGSGVYSVDWDGESASPKVEELLANLRTDGVAERLQKRFEHIIA
ncbi:hypothetical protein AAF712_011724 [Marasmius tenuissimus]|uniref:Uncharacterized protein n=1 Tax=Marasmius tenuissimus TaxID=585030 RepID=A0ABR2ZJL5_9AGAR